MASPIISKVIVAVRVRPVNKRESVRFNGATCIKMIGPKTIITDTKQRRKHEKEFTYDYSFWSANPSDSHFCDQDHVFRELGSGVLRNVFDGYNACVLAYGQTGSGKSFTMMGPEEDRGIIPRLCESMFATIEQNTTETVSFKVEVSYIEIYNEKVKDLLGNSKKRLRVREHKIFGPYVEGLNKFAVQDFKTIKRLMDEGNQARTVASTNMNNESSRSHAVFTMTVTQLQYDELSDHTGEKVSRISLVDLAGSERAGKTGATGAHLREGSNINKSLTTLGLVISALADRGLKGKQQQFIPYRDSVLTWLLKDNLGGNSKTVMVATISPSVDNFEESLSTLRYADRAKKIVNHAVVNEDPNEAMIRELREEVERLRAQLGVEGPINSQEALHALREKLSESESLMTELNMSWEEKLKRAETAMREREQALKAMGISIAGGGIAVDLTKSYLINLNSDPSMNEMLIYYLKDTQTRIGTRAASVPQDIVLSGLGIAKEHCIIDNRNGDLFVTPVGNAQTFVNGKPISGDTALAHGFRLACGSNHFFRVNTARTDDAQLSQVSPKKDKSSWEEAKKEIVMKASAAFELEKKHALDEQKKLFDKKMDDLRKQGRLLDQSMVEKARLEAEREAQIAAAEREKLRNEVLDVMGHIRDANDLSEALNYNLKFELKVRLSFKALLTHQSDGSEGREIAVLVKDSRRAEAKTKSYERFQAQLEFMREIYIRLTEGELTVDRIPGYFEPAVMEPIGVASVFLKELSHGMTTKLTPTIIGQDGKACGQLLIDLIVEPKEERDQIDDRLASQTKIEPLALGDVVKFSLCLIEARGIPSALSTFVNARYTLLDCEELMVPEIAPGKRPQNGASSKNGDTRAVFDQSVQGFIEREVTQDFLNYVNESYVAVQVWGHNITAQSDAAQVSKRDLPKGSSPALSRKAAAMLGIEVSPEAERQAIHQKFSHRWLDHRHLLNLWIEVQELNDEEGVYVNVHTSENKNIKVGPIQEIRQGFSRRLNIRIKPDQENPLKITKITGVRFGEVTLMQESSEEQIMSAIVGEPDLDVIRERFSAKLNEKCARLDGPMRSAMTDEHMDEEEKAALIQEWMELVAERDALLRPEAGSELPGAVSTAEITPGYEAKSITVYHPLADDVALRRRMTEPGSNFLELHIINQRLGQWNGQVECTVAWDATAHDDPNLLRVTGSSTYVLMQLQIDCRVGSSDTPLTLSKYVSFRVFKRAHIFKDTQKPGFFSALTGSSAPIVQAPRGTGALYDVITSIPSFDIEDLGETKEENETESISSQLRQHADSWSSLVQIDKLKQSLDMQNSRPTPRNLLRDALGNRGSKLLRAQTAPDVLVNADGLNPTRERDLLERLRLSQEEGDEQVAEICRAELKGSGKASEEWVFLESDSNPPTDMRQPIIKPDSRLGRSATTNIGSSKISTDSSKKHPQSASSQRGKYPMQRKPNTSGGKAGAFAQVNGAVVSETSTDSYAGSSFGELDPAIKSMMGIFRQKLSSASSIEELRAVGHLITVAREEQSVPESELGSLRKIYKTRQSEIEAARAAPSQASVAPSQSQDSQDIALAWKEASMSPVLAHRGNSDFTLNEFRAEEAAVEAELQRGQVNQEGSTSPLGDNPPSHHSSNAKPAQATHSSKYPNLKRIDPKKIAEMYNNQPAPYSF
eukprot:m.139667 g.139667  ORF g.139667 m.139667 type:complete len:1667 (+) comp14805_c0_seq1:372-5372(+)